MIILHSIITSSLFLENRPTRDVHMTSWRNVLRDKCSCKGSFDFNIDLFIIAANLYGSGLTSSNLQLTIDHRATLLNNVLYCHTLVVRIWGKNMRHGCRIHCARESVTHTDTESMWRPLPYLC